jgi:hypothetical protein
MAGEAVRSCRVVRRRRDVRTPFAVDGVTFSRCRLVIPVRAP